MHDGIGRKIRKRLGNGYVVFGLLLWSGASASSKHRGSCRSRGCPGGNGSSFIPKAEYLSTESVMGWLARMPSIFKPSFSQSIFDVEHLMSSATGKRVSNASPPHGYA